MQKTVSEMNKDIHKTHSGRCQVITSIRAVTCVVVIIILFSAFNRQTSFALYPHKQISQYGYSSWTRQNGLPAHSVRVALQTRDGYIWLGTTSGLLRFDGMKFEVISTDTSDKKNREVITALCETIDSSLWIGTAYDGLRRIKKGKLIPCNVSDGFPKKPIKSLLESRARHLWIGSTDGLFENVDGHCIPIPIDPPFITSLAEDTAGRIFVGSGKGVHYFIEARPKQITSILKKDGLLQEDITSIFANHNGYVWIGTQNGFFRWNKEKIELEKISAKSGNIHVTSIHEDRDNNVWVGTTQGIFRLSNGEWTNFTAAQGLLSDNIIYITEDQEGSIWICTSEGLCRFRDVNITTYTTQEGLADNFITSIIEGVDGSIYIFSAASGGSISKLKDGKLTRFTAPPPVGPSYLARDGSIWTSQSGFLSQIKSEKVTSYDTTTGLPKRWISAITEDSISLIIYLDRLGIRRFIKGALKPYVLASGTEYSSTDYVSSFYMDRSGTLWIGTMNGLVKIQNGKSTTYRTSDGLADDWIRSFSEDRQGHLWLGSPRGGLTHYRDGKFIAYNSKNGLITNEIYCVLIDDKDDVWISSPKGIGNISRKDIQAYEEGKTNIVHLQVYTTADGMRTEECFGSWQPAGWKTRDGKLWFATMKGAVAIDPRKFKRNEVPPPIYIEQCISDMEAIPLNQFKPLLPGREKFEFHYTALSYLVPDRVLFKYFLEGYDHEWVEAGTRRVAYYTNLPSGRYIFRVVGCNNDGVWNDIGASFTFELLPHFYETFWFYTLLTIALGGIIYGTLHWRVWKYRQREKELEQRVHDRTSQLEIANKELESFSYSVSHDLRAPLRGVNSLVNAILEDYKDKLDERVQDSILRIRTNTKHVEELMDDILNLSRIMRTSIQHVSIDLSSLAHSIAQNLVKTQPERKVTLIIAPDMEVIADRNLMEIALQNLLENAWKFTSKHPSAKIEVSCMLKNRQKVFFVRDDGDGFDMMYANNLFTAFQRIHKLSEFEGSGIGLATVRRIIDRHGGQIWAEAEKDKGATFYFTIPHLESNK